jgi:hypothetical protein
MSNGRGVLQTDAGGGNIRVRLCGEDSGGELAVIEEVLGAEFEGPPLHVHPSFGEGFYVLEGELTFRMEDEMVSGARDVRLRAEGRPAHLRQPQRELGAGVDLLRACGLRALFRVAGRATGGRRAAPRAAGGGPVHSGGRPADRRRVGPLGHLSTIPK